MKLKLIKTFALTFWLGVTALSGAADAPVTLVENGTSFTLANGVITTRIDKQSGMFSLKFQNAEVINRGYWSQVGRSAAGDIGRFGSKRSTAVRIDPAKNDGARAEVSVRFGYDGKSAGLPCDVDLRFALGRGDQALYTSGIWEHKPEIGRAHV